MLPALDPSFTTANPTFEALYRDLCTTKLNSDGTTKLDARSQKEHEAIAEELHRARVTVAKHDLVKSSLSSLAFSDGRLPDDIQELVAIVAAAIEQPLTEEEAELLQGDVQRFKNNLAIIAPSLSQAFEQDLATLAQVISPLSASESQDLIPWIENAKHRIKANVTELHSARLQLAEEVSHIHDLYRAILETSIRTLEQTVHGSVARGLRARAEYLATVAEGMSKKLQLQHHQLVASTYSPEMEAALKAKSQDLQREGNVLRRRVREAEEKLETYRQAGGVGGLAREYAEVQREIERVEEDVAKLERAKS